MCFDYDCEDDDESTKIVFFSGEIALLKTVMIIIKMPCTYLPHTSNPR